MTKSMIFFGLTRGGSSITNRLLHVLVNSASIELNDLGGKAYKDGVQLDNIAESSFYEISDTNVYVGPFRQLPKGVTPRVLKKFNKIIVFRDPRDCLVSHYFAFKNIHANFVAGEGAVGKGRNIPETIDEYVVKQAPIFLKTYKDYLKIMDEENDVYHYRYEDIIVDAVSWISNVCYNLSLEPSEDGLQQAIIEAAFSKIKPNVNSHNRQGMWGDFNLQLQPETISELNSIFKDVIVRLNYDVEALGYQLLSDENITLKKELDSLKKVILKLMNENGKRNREIRALTEVQRSHQHNSNKSVGSLSEQLEQLKDQLSMRDSEFQAFTKRQKEQNALTNERNKDLGRDL